MLSNDSLRFVPTLHRVQQRDAHKRKLQQVSTRAQNAKYSGDKKAKFTSIPSLTLSRYLLTEIRAKHGTGRIGAKRYGAHMGYGAGAVRARCGRGTWPAPFTVCSPYGQRTGPLWVPVPPIVGTAPTIPLRACLLGLFLVIVSSDALFTTRMANRTIKYTHHLQHRKTWEPDKTYIYFQNQRHAATITTNTNTTVIITNLPQFFSSEPSAQSSQPSHT